MGNTVAGLVRERQTSSSWRADACSLYAPNGGRKYLNHAERQRVLGAMTLLKFDQALFALTLAWTGARVSEILALTPSSFQLECGTVAIQTLKRRKHSVREVPIPPTLMTELNRYFGIARAQPSARPTITNDRCNTFGTIYPVGYSHGQPSIFRWLHAHLRST